MVRTGNYSALATFVGLVGKALNWQYTDICVVIITGFGAF